jgi:hypothetical protein
MTRARAVALAALVGLAVAVSGCSEHSTLAATGQHVGTVTAHQKAGNPNAFLATGIAGVTYQKASGTYKVDCLVAHCTQRTGAGPFGSTCISSPLAKGYLLCSVALTKSEEPQATTAPTRAGPVSNDADLTDTCTLGFMPTGQGAVFQAGPPQPQHLNGQSYYPVVGYQLTLTNNGTTTADIAGWVVAFYDGSGTELGSDQEQNDNDDGEFLTAGQTLTWDEYAPDDTAGNPQNFGDDQSIPSDGSAATCQLVEWLHP